MAHTKTWKIGELCNGGIITAEITGKIIVVINKQWDYSKGTRRSSDQSQAKELSRGTVEATDRDAIRKLDNFLCDLTTSYHASLVTDWIKTKVKIESSPW